MGADGTLSSNQSSRSRYNIGALIYSLRNSSGIARVAQATLELCRSLERRDLRAFIFIYIFECRVTHRAVVSNTDIKATVGYD